jgi:hypothetical protein
VKAFIQRDTKMSLYLEAYEKGDEPAGSVDVPPELINAYQKADLALDAARSKIIKHLEETDQHID